MDYEIEVDADVTAVQGAVREGLRSADPEDVAPRDYQPLCLALRSADGTLVGGLFGGSLWSWLMIDGLWVAKPLRGQGLGSRLLLSGEAVAVARGCRGVWLGTFDFQARGFYERHGYAVFAVLPGFPAGHSHFHLRKELTPPPIPADKEHRVATDPSRSLT